MHSAVDFDKMRSQLHSMDHLRTVLGETEPLSQATFAPGPGHEFQLTGGWEGMEDMNAPVGCILRTAGGEAFRLTRQSMLEVGALPGIPRKLQERTPVSLLKAQLDYWYSGKAGKATSVPGEIKVFYRGPKQGEDLPVVLGMARGTITPFSNLSMLDALEAGVRARYGADAEILVDYKLNHNLERSDFRLIIPGNSRVIEGTRVANDTWCTGLNMRNSLTGLKQPRLDGYLFRYWCTNGSIDTMATAGALARRAVESPEQAYEWARTSVDTVLGGLEGSLDHVQELAGIEVVGAGDGEGGNRLRTVLEDLFAARNIPVRERQRVIAAIAELGGTITMYDIMQAITMTANLSDGSLSPVSVERIMTLGGHTVHAAHDRCNECFRLLPEGFAGSVAQDALAHGAEPSAN